MAAWKKLRAFVARLATEHGTPARLLFACVVGAIVGTTPLFGLHVFVCIALAKLFRLNQVVVYGAANISIPPLAPFLGAASIAVGGRLLRGETIAVSVDALAGASPWRIARTLFVDWMVGAPFVGGAIGVVLGSIVGGVAHLRRSRSDPFRPIVRAVDARFARAPIALRQYAFWKVRLDPAYRAVAEALDDARQGARDVVDLGTGLGILPLVLWLREEDVRVRGVDHDEEKIRAAKQACFDAPIDLEVADLRSWTPPTCDAITLVDVLHYFDVETQQAIVARAFDALRPGGTLIVREADRGPHGSRWTRALERIAVTIGWHRGARPTFRSIDELRGDLERLGATVDVVPLSGPLHPGNAMLRARKMA